MSDLPVCKASDLERPGESGTLYSPSRRLAVSPFRNSHCSTAHTMRGV